MMTTMLLATRNRQASGDVGQRRMVDHRGVRLGRQFIEDATILLQHEVLLFGLFCVNILKFLER
jgi:hypothetical protein